MGTGLAGPEAFLKEVKMLEGRRWGEGLNMQRKFPSKIGEGGSWKQALINNFCICHTEKGN